MSAPTPREVLEGLPPATCYRTHTQPDENRGVYGAVWKADVVRAITRREPLDVEVLAQHEPYACNGPFVCCSCGRWDERSGPFSEHIAAEYARLEAER